MGLPSHFKEWELTWPPHPKELKGMEWVGPFGNPVLDPVCAIKP